MLTVLVRLLVHSAALLLATAALFWGVVGSAAARRSGRPRAVGALVGAVLPMIGAPLMLVPPSRTGSSGAPAGAAGWSAAPSGAAGWSAAPSGAAGWSVTAPGSPGRSAGSEIWQPPASAGQYGRGMPVVRQPVRARDWLLLVPAALAAVALLGAAVEPWLALRAPVLDVVGVGAGQVGMTAVPVLIGCLVLVAAAVLQVRRPSGLWPVVAAGVGTLALLVSLQLLIVTGFMADVLSRFGHAVPRGVGVRPAPGAFLLLVGGVLAFGWAALSMALCPARETAPR